MAEDSIDDLSEVKHEIEISVPASEIQRIQNDIRNVHSCVEVQYLYNKLRKMGPWDANDLTIEVFLENDALHSALVAAYGRIFTKGLRRIARKKVPFELRPIHEALLVLRNKRYAHSDSHESIETSFDLDFDGKTIFLNTGLSMTVVLGAPKEWKPLFDWLNGYLFDQLESQLARLSDITGYTWEQKPGPVPSWVDDAD